MTTYARPRVLVAPVTVTPTKPLTPSHVKGLLWVDVLYRATALVADVDYRYSLTTYNVTAQTLGFWAYLDSECPEVDPESLTEEAIGEHYVRYQGRASPASYDVLRCYADRAEATGWVHPVSARMLRIWAGRYAALGLHDPGLTAVQPPGLELAGVLRVLTEHGLCLDLRGDGGPVYLDATRFGLPLRRIVSAEGQPNYLACALRDLLPLAGSYDRMVLLYDRELDADYVLLSKVLEVVGGVVSREVVERVPIDGVVRSSRHGGWQGYTVADLLSGVRDAGDTAAVRLGVRLYFIAVLGRGVQQSFRMDLLRQSVVRAGRLLAAGSRTDPVAMDRILRRSMGNLDYVDPYRLTSALLGRGNPPVRELARAVFC
ncbi:hypothetical protein [Couchioplanes azureus]|uniref:hypothetical protein n=1 Tax=Couchioplanes caeruleus TaxID=56438 RepID=UPI001670A05F|nr:hypothetical protein [Couchioplanes caeruleus]GGQ71667.1 hypothetical protein GCM10010166_47260 [Couchioplanes caeruleus subsp. azureus]